MYKVPITNAIMFSIVMRNERYCREVIERILGRKIDALRFVPDDGYEEDGRVTVEDTVIASFTGRNIRIDVKFENDLAWYNIEMQVHNERNIPKRSRYHHDVIDIQDLKMQKEDARRVRNGKRVTFNDLKKSYVIFICCFDSYGKGKSLYCFERYDRKNDLSCGDDSYTIIVNSTVIEDDLSDELKSFLRYIRDGKVDENDQLIVAMDQLVEHESLEKGVEIMRLEEEIYVSNQFHREEGIKEGLKEGRKEGRMEEKNQNIERSVKRYQRLKLSADNVTSFLVEDYELEEEEAREYVNQYWANE